MWLVFLLLILLISLIFSSIEINLCKIDVIEKNYNYRIIITLKLFGIFKILFIKLDKNRVMFLGKKLDVNKYKIRKIDKELFDLLKSFKIELKKIDFTCKVGLIDIGLTNLLVILFSSIFPIIVKNRIKKEKFKFKVFPEYNKFCFKFDGKIIISLKTLTIIKLYFKNIKSKMTHNKSKNYNVKESF